MATRHLLAALVDAAAAEGLPALETESVGGVDAARRVAAGEHLDLVFLAADALADLAAAGHVDAATISPLVVSEVVAASPDAAVEAAAGPGGAAFADASGMRAALLDARRIGYSTGPSGTALRAMIVDWGLEDALRGRFVQAPPGVPVAHLLAQGEVDLGFQQLSELVGQPGIRIRGTLPPDCAITTVFAGAVATTADEPDEARLLLEFFASDRASAITRRHGFAPAPVER